MDELKSVAFSMNLNSTAGSDGMNGYFFKKGWHIMKIYLMVVVLAFFNG